MRLHLAALVIGTVVAAGAASAETTKLAIGISGWAGFAPLTLATQTGIFKTRGLDVTVRKIPQKDRHLALASGEIQCAATTVETHVAWNANGVPIVQVLELDKSYGADGLAVRPTIAKIADLKGKTVGVDAPGTTSYFGLAWILKKNNLSMKDITVATMSAQAAAQAFVAGQNDAAMTYEPYLSTVRGKPDSGRIIATTLDYPMVIDTLGCTPKFIAENPKAVQGLVDGYFDALQMIKTDAARANEIMGADLKQTGEQFAKSASYLRWQDKAANQKFFAGEVQAFANEAADLLLEAGIIKAKPDLAKFVDSRFVK